MANLESGEQYTPGPWFVVGYGRMIRNSEEGMQGHTICTLDANKGESIFQNYAANACLIAAAPELAEALRGASQYMVRLKAYLATCATDVIIDNLESTIAGLRNQVDSCEAALKKAGL